MSQFIGAALPQFILQKKDRRLVPVLRADRIRVERNGERDMPTAYPGGYCNDFWPGNRGQPDDSGTLVSTFVNAYARLAWGIASRVGFVGVTRDQFGAPLGGVTCSLFRTSTREWIMDIISDANGNFLLQSWYSPDTHFIVFAKAGSPNVYGATDQNLVGA
jgi:hypothetical protein